MLKLLLAFLLGVVTPVRMVRSAWSRMCAWVRERVRAGKGARERAREDDDTSSWGV